MGHYYAELMCDRCGHLSCRCSRKPEPPPTGFIVCNSYAVITASELATKDWLAYMYAKKFDTRELAETAALAQLESHIDGMEAELVTLRELRKAMT